MRCHVLLFSRIFTRFKVLCSIFAAGRMPKVNRQDPVGKVSLRKWPSPSSVHDTRPKAEPGINTDQGPCSGLGYMSAERTHRLCKRGE